MRNKIRNIFLVVSLIICFTGVINAQSVKEISGKYVSQLSDRDVLLLMDDGKFVLRESGLTVKGKWDIEDGNEVKLKWSDFGEALKTRAKAKYKDGKLTDQDGVVWIKK